MVWGNAMFRAVSVKKVAPLLAVSLAAGLLLLSPPLASQGPSAAASGETGETNSAPPPAPIESKVSGKAGSIKASVDALVEKVKEMGGTVGVAIADVSTGELLGAHQEHKAFNPASNAKILTAATALSLLNPNHRFQTTLHGSLKSGTVSNLVLRGTGDPSLTTRDLWDMVRELKEAGVKKIDGDIQVDQRFFDEQFVPPAFEQQPNEWAYFRAPVSAIAVNENTVTMTVRPGAKGGPAVVVFDPPGIVEVDGTIKTGEDGNAQSIGLQMSPQGTRLVAKISGSIPSNSKPMSFTKRLENPQLAAGMTLKALLKESGIALSGDVKPGGEKSRAPAIVTHSSRPLSTLLYELGKQSDNFYAEMVFKALALEKKGRPAKAGNAADVVTKYLQDAGAWEDGNVVKNGSGLFDANRISSASFVKLLRAVYRDPAISNEFVAQLAIGGADGTLKSRYKKLKWKRIVRAKTGTLEAAATLSGYVLGPPGKGPIAFSIQVNNVAGRVSDARAAIDRCVESAAKYLWKDAGKEGKDTKDKDELKKQNCRKGNIGVNSGVFNSFGRVISTTTKFT